MRQVAVTGVCHHDDNDVRMTQRQGHADRHHDGDHPGSGGGARLLLPPLLQVSLESQQDHGGLHRQEKHSSIASLSIRCISDAYTTKKVF